MCASGCAVNFSDVTLNAARAYVGGSRRSLVCSVFIFLCWSGSCLGAQLRWIRRLRHILSYPSRSPVGGLSTWRCLVHTMSAPSCPHSNAVGIRLCAPSFSSDLDDGSARLQPRSVPASGANECSPSRGLAAPTVPVSHEVGSKGFPTSTRSESDGARLQFAFKPHPTTSVGSGPSRAVKGAGAASTHVITVAVVTFSKAVKASEGASKD